MAATGLCLLFFLATPPPPTKVTIVGKNEVYHWENLVGPFVIHKLLGPRPPPPPPPPPQHPGHCRCYGEERVHLPIQSCCTARMPIRTSSPGAIKPVFAQQGLHSDSSHAQVLLWGGGVKALGTAGQSTAPASAALTFAGATNCSGRAWASALPISAFSANILDSKEPLPPFAGGSKAGFGTRLWGMPPVPTPAKCIPLEPCVFRQCFGALHL